MRDSTNDPPTIPADFLTVKEAAERCHVNERTIWEALRDGKLTRHGRPRDKKTYVKVSELAAAFDPKPVAAKRSPRTTGRPARRIERF